METTHVEGQFDDAPGDVDNIVSPAPPAVAVDARTNGAAFIDDVNNEEDRGLLEWSEDEDEDEHLIEQDESDGPDEADFDEPRVEDEDWEMAERDFTKQYNRLRQHVAVRSGTTQASSTGPSSSHNASKTDGPRTVTAPLPAVNRPPEVGVARRGDHTTDQLTALSKYASRLAKIDWPYQMGIATNKKMPSATANMKDKSDRATSEQVLDPRTRLILFKMIGRGLIQEVNGCVSTGKEANVYHATSPEGTHLALKIFKTSILVFKDRDKYVSGEYRFRRGYNRHNPRKMVRVWAEKEMRNLKRINAAGIPSPSPVEVRENVLVMTFIGDEQGWASPRLKDAEIEADAYTALYIQLVLAIRRIFHVCKLVHADLSEYNLLLHSGLIYIIDVSQAVEHDHPHAFDFLRSDVRNAELWFAKAGVRGLGTRRCFEFVVKEDVGAGTEMGPGQDEVKEREALERWIAETPQDGEEGRERELEDEVFLKSYIPRTLNEVFDPERDMQKLGKEGNERPIYADTIGIVGPGESKGASEVVGKNDAVADEAEEVDDEQDEEDGSDDAEDEGFKERQPRGHRNEDKDAKKERKSAVKAENRERRKNKMPKAEKKKKIKATSRS